MDVKTFWMSKYYYSNENNKLVRGERKWGMRGV